MSWKYFFLVFTFDSPLKRKTEGFLTFSGGPKENTGKKGGSNPIPFNNVEKKQVNQEFAVFLTL